MSVSDSSSHRSADLPFESIYRHGFARVAVAIPPVSIADPTANAGRTIDLARGAAERGTAAVLFPELNLSGYSNEDLIQQDALLDASMTALGEVVEASQDLRPLIIVGLPIVLGDQLYNCAAVVHRGRVLGVVPKMYLPNYREFYEKRQWTAGRHAPVSEIELFDEIVPFGRGLIFEASDLAGFSLAVEICEDVWVPIPPSTLPALGGATVLANLSASNITVGKADYRRLLCSGHSGRTVSAYLYAAAGLGESTTDLAWDGHAMIWENAELLAESERFRSEGQLIVADVDLERLRQDRMRMTSYGDSVGEYRDEIASLRRVSFELDPPVEDVGFERALDRFPFVPSGERSRDERCYEAYQIQVLGLVQRLQATGIEKVVIGVSGGLDSTQALIVCARTMDRLGLPRENVLAYTMPGFATGEASRDNAWRLMRSLGVTAEEIDIRPSCEQMLKDIGHPFADGEPRHDVTFENVQAGERTSHLFRLANLHGALVVGTGDLSELALGWATYGVGDQMSHYNVNASVPKTLIQHLIRRQAERDLWPEEARETFRAVVAAEITPELVPEGAAENAGGSQNTEAVVGPYELQDFHLYFVSRYGFRPSKVAFLAWRAWRDAEVGDWPSGLPEADRRTYDLATVKSWLRVFLKRFFQTSQFKRSAMPNGPKVGSGGSLSPRGDWRAPSDAGAKVWLDELETNVPD